MCRTVVAICILAAFAAAPADAGAPNAAPAGDAVASLARSVVGNERDPLRKTRLIVDWLNANFAWTATDDVRDRTVAAIVARRGGNCAEQANVARAMLESVGVRTRAISEVNLQPPSDFRQRGADSLILKLGLRASVFGRGHNDHRWIEVYDPARGDWLPADPTLGVVGLDQWMSARVSFGARPVHKIIPSRDMIVPVAILALPEDGDYAHAIDRSRHYLVDSFGRLYRGRVAQAPDWSRWTRDIGRISPAVIAAFQGRHDLRTDAPALEDARSAYAGLRHTIAPETAARD